MAIQKNECVEFAMLAERVYRTFLELIKHELDSAGIIDISPIQAAVLLNIDNNTITMSEVISRGYYMGSNASYNLKKMINNGYINQLQSDYDKRTSFLKLTNKGRNLLDSLQSKISGHAKSLESNIKEKMNLYKLNNCLKNVNNYWKNIIDMGHRI